jgi:hypothetical protein
VVSSNHGCDAWRFLMSLEDAPIFETRFRDGVATTPMVLCCSLRKRHAV